jgi:single-strand DNA-binding protein
VSGINKAILVGRLGKDPESRQTRAGKEFSSFSMATSKKIGEEEKTTWHNVVVWNEHSAKYINDFAQKGTMVYVEGEIENRTWEKQDGSKGYTTDIVVGQYNGNVQILADGVPREGEGRPARKTHAQARGKPAREELEPQGIDPELDDEIPF